MNTEANVIGGGGCRHGRRAEAAPGPKAVLQSIRCGFRVGTRPSCRLRDHGPRSRGIGRIQFTGCHGSCRPSPRQHTAANEFYAEYLGDGTKSPLMDWLVFEVLGVFVGGFISGALAGRIAKSIERGPSITNRWRLIFAFIGGALMGFGAKLARGCTSGQALTGGALLGVGSWAFMMCVFAGAYATAWFVRRQWK